MKTKRRTFPGIGSVSSGTLRTEDLLSAFADLCRDYGGKDGRRMNREYERMSPEEVDGEEGGYLLDEMRECLEGIAPDYVTFGALDGDGADFGFWPDLDRVNEDTAGTDPDVLKVNDLSEVPKDYRGAVMHVSDHGNVTLYSKTARKFHELWSCV